MAISKQQPMRPALDDCIDEINGMGNVSQDIATLTQSLSATNQNVLLLTGEVNEIEQETLPALSNRVSTLEDVSDYYIRGVSQEITIPANDSLSTSIVFSEPFPATALCGVFPCVVTGELSTLFDITIIDCTYSGFSFQVTNSDADDHQIHIGYIAVAFDIPEEE